MRQARDEVLEIARQIELGRGYPDIGGPLCQFCDFLEICDVGREFQQTTAGIEPVDL